MELSKMLNKSSQPLSGKTRHGRKIIGSVLTALLSQLYLGNIAATVSANQKIIEGKTKEEVLKEL